MEGRRHSLYQLFLKRSLSCTLFILKYKFRVAQMGTPTLVVSLKAFNNACMSNSINSQEIFNFLIHLTNHSFCFSCSIDHRRSYSCTGENLFPTKRFLLAHVRQLDDMDLGRTLSAAYFRQCHVTRLHACPNIRTGTDTTRGTEIPTCHSTAVRTDPVRRCVVVSCIACCQREEIDIPVRTNRREWTSWIACNHLIVLFEFRREGRDCSQEEVDAEYAIQLFNGER